MIEDQETKGAWKVKAALVALPLFLALSTAGAVWYHWQSDQEKVADPALAMPGEGIDPEEVADSLMKLTEYIGERDWETEEGRKNMRRVLSFVEGTLSPQNYGFVVHKGAEVSYEGELWPMVWVDVVGKKRKKEVVLVCATYDRDDASLVSLMTAARALRGAELERTVRFLLFPEALLVERSQRGGGMKSGEEIVALLQLRQMGKWVDGDGTKLSVKGPDLGVLEGHLKHEQVERQLWSTDKVHKWFGRVFGAAGAEHYQMILPVGAEALPTKERNDLPSLIERTSLLVELVTGLAAE